MRAAPQETWSIRKDVVNASGGLVAAQHVGAAEVGADVLAAGGNAVDAALAASLALGVLEPWMSGLGGGGVMIVAKAGDAADAIDFGMVAPARLDPAAYPLIEGRDDELFGWPAVLERRNLLGPLSIGVPGRPPASGWPIAATPACPGRTCAPGDRAGQARSAGHLAYDTRIAAGARDLAEFDAARALYLPGWRAARAPGRRRARPSSARSACRHASSASRRGRPGGSLRRRARAPDRARHPDRGRRARSEGPPPATGRAAANRSSPRTAARPRPRRAVSPPGRPSPVPSR